MKTYLVGGAIRDERLGRPVKDRDWVVVGATPEQMIAAGFKPVGKDFPVFLHPETHEEYALARTERKSGRGYHGFVFNTDVDVTLEQDLARRDLTINAIARDADGQYIDPFGGLDDLEQGILRHVSGAFAEDPLRVLRVARFAARYHHIGFSVADETLALMSHCVEAGELDHLVAERVWQEIDAALNENDPQLFLQVLRACGALETILPEVDCLYGIPQPAEWHPEIDTGIHIEMVLKQAAMMALDSPARFAALVHDLGKGITPAEKLPSHPGHEAAGVPLVRDVCERLKVPRKHQQLAEAVTRHHLKVHTAFELKAGTVLKLLLATNAIRNAEFFEQFLLACEADSRGRPTFEDRDYSQRDYLLAAAAAVRECDLSPALDRDQDKQQMVQQIQALRINAIRPVRAHWRQHPEGLTD